MIYTGKIQGAFIQNLLRDLRAQYLNANFAILLQSSGWLLGHTRGKFKSIRGGFTLIISYLIAVYSFKT